MTMTYEQKFKIGDIVKGKRTFNGEVIEGKFNGFRLYNKLNPKSVVGVIDTNERCYDVSVDSIESLESEDEKIRKVVKEYINQHYPVDSPVMHKSKILNWLEKQKPIKLNEEDEKIKEGLIKYLKTDMECNPSQCESFYNKSIAWLEKQGEQKPWSEEDEENLNRVGDAQTTPNQMEMLESCIDKMSMTAPNLWKKEIDWLNSLKDRVKPQLNRNGVKRIKEC